MLLPTHFRRKFSGAIVAPELESKVPIGVWPVPGMTVTQLQSGGYVTMPEKAFDADTTGSGVNNYLSSFSGNSYQELMIEFAEPVLLSRVAIKPPDNTSYYGWAFSLNINKSIGIQMVNTGNYAWEADFPVIEARTIKINFHGQSGTFGHSGSMVHFANISLVGPKQAPTLFSDLPFLAYFFDRDKNNTGRHVADIGTGTLQITSGSTAVVDSVSKYGSTPKATKPAARTIFANSNLSKLRPTQKPASFFFRIKPDMANSSTQSIIERRDADNTAQMSINIATVNGERRVGIYVGNNFAATSTRAVTKLQEDVLNDVMIVMDNQTITFMVNGVVESFPNRYTPVDFGTKSWYMFWDARDNASLFNIGSMSSNGYIADFAIWDRALTKAEYDELTNTSLRTKTLPTLKPKQADNAAALAANSVIPTLTSNNSQGYVASGYTPWNNQDWWTHFNVFRNGALTRADGYLSADLNFGPHVQIVGANVNTFSKVAIALPKQETAGGLGYTSQIRLELSDDGFDSVDKAYLLDIVLAERTTVDNAYDWYTFTLPAQVSAKGIKLVHVNTYSTPAWGQFCILRAKFLP